MKKIIILLLLILFPITVRAINLCPDGSDNCCINTLMNVSSTYWYWGSDGSNNYQLNRLNGNYNYPISKIKYYPNVSTQTDPIKTNFSGKTFFCIDAVVDAPSYVNHIRKLNPSNSLDKGLIAIYRAYLLEKNDSTDNWKKDSMIAANDAMRILVARTGNSLTIANDGNKGYYGNLKKYLIGAGALLSGQTSTDTTSISTNNKTVYNMLQKWYCIGARAYGHSDGNTKTCKNLNSSYFSGDNPLITLDNFKPEFTEKSLKIVKESYKVEYTYQLSGTGYDNLKTLFSTYPASKTGTYLKTTSCSTNVSGYTCKIGNASKDLFGNDNTQVITIEGSKKPTSNITVTVNYEYKLPYDTSSIGLITYSDKYARNHTSSNCYDNSNLQRFLLLDVTKSYTDKFVIKIKPASTTTTKAATTTVKTTTVKTTTKKPTTTTKTPTTTNTLYRACKIKDGKYYDKDGKETNLDTFMKECCELYGKPLPASWTDEMIDAWDKYCYKDTTTTTAAPKGCEYNENGGNPIYKFNDKVITELEYLNHGCCDLELKYLTDTQAKEKYKKTCQSTDVIHLEYECNTKYKLGTKVDTGTGVEVTECTNEYDAYTKDSYIWQEPMATVMSRVNTLESSDAYKDDISEFYSSSGVYNNIDRSYMTTEGKTSTGEKLSPVSAGNNYCMLYTSESNDMHFPGTAVATSGRFFVFNELTREECVNSPNPSNNCFRQPSIDGKIYVTMHTNFDKWEKDYLAASADEIKYYNKWKDSNSNKDKQLYNAAKAKRVTLETYKTECENHNQVTKFFNYNLKPEITFKFTQKAYDGNKTIDVTDSIEMSISYEAVKYWPNATSSPKLVAGSTSGTPNTKSYTIKYGDVNETKTFDKTENYAAAFTQTVYYKPSQVTYATIGSGLVQLANDVYQDTSYMYENGVLVGYVYNVRLTTYKGAYTTAFTFDKLGHQGYDNQSNIQRSLEEYKKENNFTELSSECVYCNQEGEFRRECEVCPEPTPEDPTPMKAAYIYRSIALSDVTPHDRDNTNWSDEKGKSAEARIESLSGSNVVAVLTNNKTNVKATVLSETGDNAKAQVLANDTIYNDSTREYLEYEFTLNTKDMQIIRANNSRSDFDYGEINMCTNTNNTVSNPSKSQDANYCFICNQDGKECVSTFIDAFADTATTANTRETKWKYFFYNPDAETGTWYQGKMSSISAFEDGRYPDPLNQEAYLKIYKNWP